MEENVLSTVLSGEGSEDQSSHNFNSFMWGIKYLDGIWSLFVLFNLWTRCTFCSGYWKIWNKYMAHLSHVLWFQNVCFWLVSFLSPFYVPPHSFVLSFIFHFTHSWFLLYYVLLLLLLNTVNAFWKKVMINALLV